MSDEALAAGYTGWDMSKACIITDALITLVALPSMILLWRRYEGAFSPSNQSLLNIFSFATFGIGMEFGFGGLAHALLRSNYIAGQAFTKVWFEGAWTWMLAWTMGMVLGCVAAGAQLVTAFSWAQVDTNWSTATIVLSTLILGVELYQCIVDINTSGSIVAVWSVLSFAAAAIAVLSKGCGEKGAALFAAGCVSGTVGFLVLLTAPAACRDYDHELQVSGRFGVPEEGCPYPAHFNQNAVFHVFIILGVLLSLAGMTQKLDDERKSDYQNVLTQNGMLEFGAVAPRQ